MIGMNWAGDIRDRSSSNKVRQECSGLQQPGRERREQQIAAWFLNEKMPLTFAILKDRVWYEKGEVMGFGYVKNPKDDETWSYETCLIREGIPSNTMLSVFDCHI